MIENVPSVSAYEVEGVGRADGPQLISFRYMLQQKLPSREEHSPLTVTLGPVVTSTRLAKNKVVGPEEVSERTSSNGVHGSRLEIDKDRSRNVLAAWFGDDRYRHDEDTNGANYK